MPVSNRPGPYDLAGAGAGAPELYIGLMSGTSIDGVDGVLAAFSETRPDPVNAASGQPTEASTFLTVQTLEFASAGFPDDLQRELTAFQSTGPDELERAARASIGLAEVYAQVIETLLTRWRARIAAYDGPKARPQIVAVGAHGQTVRHRPASGYTIQLMAGAHLAERCGIDVICDFRSADVAAGGQGAPLVPAFHQGVFGSGSKRRAIVNIGGIANVSLLAPGEPVRGYDTGPGNTLLDAWIRQQQAKPYDADGQWAGSGRAQPDLLDVLLADPYFSRALPKSTHRDYFTLDWVGSRLAARAVTPTASASASASTAAGAATLAAAAAAAAAALKHPGPALAADLQATLSELTAASIAEAVSQFSADEVYVCGGGARNLDLLARIARRVTPATVATTRSLGIDPQAVEALAFAWLARQRVHGLPGNELGATGARGLRVLGAWYPAGGG